MTLAIPLYWSEEGCEADIVRCHEGHIATREAFENVGCPYCNRTAGERAAFVEGLQKGRAER